MTGKDLWQESDAIIHPLVSKLLKGASGPSVVTSRRVSYPHMIEACSRKKPNVVPTLATPLVAQSTNVVAPPDIDQLDTPQPAVAPMIDPVVPTIAEPPVDEHASKVSQASAEYVSASNLVAQISARVEKIEADLVKAKTALQEALDAKSKAKAALKALVEEPA